MITKPTVDLLRAAWMSGVQEILDGEIRITLEALVDATDPATIAALQGKARAFRTMRRFPDYVAAFLPQEPADGKAQG